MVSYADYKEFHPELIKTMFLEVMPPERLYRRIFKAPMAMGLYSFSQGSFDDPFAILPPVDDLQDAKSMFAEQEIEDYSLQDYRGFVDISNKVINQFERAGNMAGLITQLRERYAMILREAWENTLEYTCFAALDAKRSVLSTSHDWTSSSVTADHIIADLVNARKAYHSATRFRPNVCILNPEASAQMLLRKDVANQLYTSNRNLDTGEIGNMLAMNFSEQAGGYTDFEGSTLTMFAPVNTGKNQAYLFNNNPSVIGYPVVFGAPDFNVVDNYDKNSVRIYVNGHMGFVYGSAQRVDSISV